MLNQNSVLAKKRPTVIRADNRPVGYRLTLKLRSGTSFDDLVRLVPNLEVHYGVREVRVEREVSNGSRAYATFCLRNPFGQGAIPWPGVYGKSVSGWDPIPIGINEDGDVVSIPIPGNNLSVGGEPGSGKSVELSVIIANLLHDPTVHLYLFDGKGVEFGAWIPLASGYVGADLSDGVSLLDTILANMEDRYATMASKGVRKLERHHGLGLMVVVIDELPFYSANSDTKASKEFNNKLRDVVARGRAAGIVTIFAAQKPSADTIPSAIRDLINLRLAFRCSTKEASDTILGGGWASQGFSATSIAPDERGVGLFLGGNGVPQKIRGYWVSDNDIFSIVDSLLVLRSRNMEGEL